MPAEWDFRCESAGCRINAEDCKALAKALKSDTILFDLEVASARASLPPRIMPGTCRIATCECDGALNVKRVHVLRMHARLFCAAVSHCNCCSRGNCRLLQFTLCWLTAYMCQKTHELRLSTVLSMPLLHLGRGKVVSHHQNKTSRQGVLHAHERLTSSLHILHTLRRDRLSGLQGAGGDAYKKNASPQYAPVAGNTLGDKGCEALAKLESKTGLKTLAVGGVQRASLHIPAAPSCPFRQAQKALESQLLMGLLPERRLCHWRCGLHGTGGVFAEQLRIDENGSAWCALFLLHDTTCRWFCHCDDTTCRLINVRLDAWTWLCRKCPPVLPLRNTGNATSIMGCEALGGALKTNSTLTKLNLPEYEPDGILMTANKASVCLLCVVAHFLPFT
eukprot:4841328-Pleurochrysis_carterae.AAC.1